MASRGRSIFPGGKGLNQSVAAARAGQRVQHFGAVGEDGGFLVELLRQEGVGVTGIRSRAGTSGHAVIQVDDDGRNAIVISGGSNLALDEDLVADAVRAAGDKGWMLLQNETNHVDLCLQKAAAAGVPVALNLAPADPRIHDYPLHLLHVLIVNEAEAMALARQSEPLAAFDALVTHYPQVSLVLTLGSAGLLAYQAQPGSRLQLNGFAVDAVDETAAGDAFVGYFMAGMCSGMPFADSLLRASAAGALAVTAAGAATSIPDAVQVDGLLAAQQLTFTQRES